jgi:hypothetical protein
MKEEPDSWVGNLDAEIDILIINHIRKWPSRNDPIHCVCTTVGAESAPLLAYYGDRSGQRGDCTSDAVAKEVFTGLKQNPIAGPQRLPVSVP